MGGEQNLGLDDGCVDVLGQCGMHWVSHMYGPDVYEAYSAEVDAVHERLHGEIHDLLPRPADASLWVVVDLDVVDMSIDCPAHPQFARLPVPDAAGRWRRAVRLHRHDDGSPGAEANDTVVCRLLGALATYGGQVSATVHPPRPEARNGAREAPAQAGANWRVAPLGVALPEPDRPTIMEAWPTGSPHTRSALRDAVDMTPPAGGPTAAWRAVTACLWDVPVAPRDAQWIETQPKDFLAALEEGMKRLEALPELNRPLAAAAYAVRLELAADQLDDDADGGYEQLVLRAAAAHLGGRASALAFARAYEAREFGPAAPFAQAVVGHVTEYWRRAQAGTVLLPETGTEAERQDPTRLRALIGRELRRA